MNDAAQPPTRDSAFARTLVIDRPPRIPFQVLLDLTYRCNNRCRHCWLWTPDSAEERAAELSTEEWRAVIDQARALGAREWAFSGGEPLLREDFAEIFEYAMSRASTYSLNTNGTLATPEIARLLKREGERMVAVYGATAEVYDHVTRHPGGFEALLQGLAYLKEAGVGFTVQLIPMRDNWHQWEEMKAFALSWSKHRRIGAPWLFKTACGDPVRNAEIERQRLDPADVVALDPAGVSVEEWSVADGADGTDGAGLDLSAECSAADARPESGAASPYAGCVEARRDFHVDPHGGTTFCSFVKDPQLRYDLRSGVSAAEAARSGEGAPVPAGIRPGAVAHAWEEFIPALTDVALAPDQPATCPTCDLRRDCRWCDVYSYLEKGQHNMKVDYLCEVTREERALKKEWLEKHRRYYDIAGITIQVDSDLAFNDTTLDRKFDCFQVTSPGNDLVTLRHHFEVPDLSDHTLGEEIYRESPWVIFRKEASYVYLNIASGSKDESANQVAVFSAKHDHGKIHNDPGHERAWREGGLQALTLFPSDQILLARLVADRQGCLLHSGAVTLDGKGLLFVGHSDAGKSTTMTLVRRELGDRVKILCDDRNVVRYWPEGFDGGSPGFYVHGTWSHGDVPDVSEASAPLSAVLFLRQDSENAVVPLSDRGNVWRRLLATLIRPLVSADWWEKELDVFERLVAQVPCYTMHFDKSGAITTHLEKLVK